MLFSGQLQFFDHVQLRFSSSGGGLLIIGLGSIQADDRARFERLEFHCISARIHCSVDQLKCRVDRAVMVDASFCDNEYVVQDGSFEKKSSMQAMMYAMSCRL